MLEHVGTKALAWGHFVEPRPWLVVTLWPACSRAWTGPPWVQLCGLGKSSSSRRWAGLVCPNPFLSRVLSRWISISPLCLLFAWSENVNMTHTPWTRACLSYACKFLLRLKCPKVIVTSGKAIKGILTAWSDEEKGFFLKCAINTTSELEVVCMCVCICEHMCTWSWLLRSVNTWDSDKGAGPPWKLCNGRQAYVCTYSSKFTIRRVSKKALGYTDIGIAWEVIA